MKTLPRIKMPLEAMLQPTAHRHRLTAEALQWAHHQMPVPDLRKPAIRVGTCSGIYTGLSRRLMYMNNLPQQTGACGRQLRGRSQNRQLSDQPRRMVSSG
jgi:hypothetical protein